MGRKIIELTGQVFGRIVVVGLIGRGHHCTWWLCRCDCGKEIKVRSHTLRQGAQTSCGCIHPKLTHGDTSRGRTREYVAWLNLRQRCNDENSLSYPDYGGRGIKVCKSWQTSFETFLADMGRKPGPRYSIDRIDNDGDYAPDNCRWASPTEQRRNMRSNVIVEVDGQMFALSAACEKSGLKYNNVRARIHRGKSFADAAY